jgi:hypothetical protein
MLHNMMNHAVTCKKLSIHGNPGGECYLQIGSPGLFPWWMPKKKSRLNDAALKALITIYGPREAARKAGIPEGTVTVFASRHKIRKATGFVPSAENPDAGDAIANAFAKDREESALNLAKYTRNASQKAAEHKDPLEVARKVRDVAGVYATLWPPGEESELIESALLMGAETPTVNPEEVRARAIEVAEDSRDVRPELQDKRPEGD